MPDQLLSYPTTPPSWLCSCLEVLLPASCLVCSRPLRATKVCYRCRPALPDLNDILLHRCQRCFGPRTTSDATCEPCNLSPCLPNTIRFLWEYDGLPRDFIRTMKYRPSLQLLSIASSILSQSIPHLFPELAWDMIVPIPSSSSTLRRRMLHPCTELAREIKREHHIPLIHALIHDTKRLPQARLTHEERLRKLLKLFAVKPGLDLRGKRVLLIEDVVTTGATVAAATYRLQQAGVSRVDVVALARTRVWSRFRQRVHSVFSTVTIKPTT
jgi:predicted amidophosphoribosyltransferase